jgi:CO/xanthine dehydrogenase Mo-binding subunit
VSVVGPRAESAIGQSVERADGRLKLAGQAEFTGDIRLPGMLYGAVLHSPGRR